MGKWSKEGKQGSLDAATTPVISALQERWPAAFPTTLKSVKPLASSVIEAVSAGMGWERDYTLGVLYVWKRRTAYCEAILRGGARVDIEGRPTGEMVDEGGQVLARNVLAARAAKRRRVENSATLSRRLAL